MIYNCRMWLRILGSFALVSAIILWFTISLGLCQKSNSLEQFVLSHNDVQGFTVISGPSYYGPESLWNYINGGALPYLDYGVGDVVTFTCLSQPDSLEIMVDIYDMADSLGAFGIYANERFPEYTYLDIGVECYHTENSYHFWKDRYYIKVFSVENEPATLAPLEKIARVMEKRIPDGGGMAWYFSLFPEQGRQKRTESYIAKNVLGQEYLQNAFTATYIREEKTFQLYLIDAQTDKGAKQHFGMYREFIGKYGKLEQTSFPLGDELFIGTEDWYGTIVFTLKGKYILGSVGLSDLKLVRSYLETMIMGLAQ